jgi:hypothetical protein
VKVPTLDTLAITEPVPLNGLADVEKEGDTDVLRVSVMDDVRDAASDAVEVLVEERLALPEDVNVGALVDENLSVRVADGEPLPLLDTETVADGVKLRRGVPEADELDVEDDVPRGERVMLAEGDVVRVMRGVDDTDDVLDAVAELRASVGDAVLTDVTVRAAEIEDRPEFVLQGVAVEERDALAVPESMGVGVLLEELDTVEDDESELRFVADTVGVTVTIGLPVFVADTVSVGKDDAVGADVCDSASVGFDVAVGVGVSLYQTRGDVVPVPVTVEEAEAVSTFDNDSVALIEGLPDSETVVEGRPETVFVAVVVRVLTRDTVLSPVWVGDCEFVRLTVTVADGENVWVLHAEAVGVADRVP